VLGKWRGAEAAVRFEMKSHIKRISIFQTIENRRSFTRFTSRYRRPLHCYRSVNSRAMRWAGAGIQKKKRKKKKKKGSLIQSDLMKQSAYTQQ
jgi:hypothetical protein